MDRNHTFDASYNDSSKKKIQVTLMCNNVIIGVKDDVRKLHSVH